MTVPKPTKAELLKHIRMEQEIVWDQLVRELRHAINGRWSIAASNTVDRLIAILKLVPPTPWESLQYELVRGEIYEAVLCAAGIEPRLPSAKAIEVTDLLMQRHFSRIALSDMPEHYEHTRLMIQQEFGPF